MVWYCYDLTKGDIESLYAFVSYSLQQYNAFPICFVGIISRRNAFVNRLKKKNAEKRKNVSLQNHRYQAISVTIPETAVTFLPSIAKQTSYADGLYTFVPSAEKRSARKAST